MAASGFTPISLYYSTTASAVPTSGNMVAGELALNNADMKLYALNSAGAVTLLASSSATTPVTTISFGTTGLTPATATSGAVTVAGTLAIANGGTGTTATTFVNLAANVTGTLPVSNGGTGQTTYTDGQLLIGNSTGNTLTKATLTAGSGVTITNGSGGITIAATGSGGTVTSVAQSFTGGLISVAGSPITGAGTLALTVAGTSGGVPYFSSSSAWASSAELTQYGIVYGGGAGAAPATTAVGTAGQVLTSNGAGVAPTFQTASGGGSFSAKTANYTAVSGDNILANTNAGSWTLTLPATPATGASVQVVDSIGTFGVYPLTVARNGSTIMSASEDMTMDVNGAATTFVYNGSTWRVI